LKAANRNTDRSCFVPTVHAGEQDLVDFTGLERPATVRRLMAQAIADWAK